MFKKVLVLLSVFATLSEPRALIKNNPLKRVAEEELPREQRPPQPDAPEENEMEDIVLDTTDVLLMRDSFMQEDGQYRPITENTWRAISEGLRQTAVLEDLSIQGLDLTDQHMEILVEGLLQNTSVTRLSLNQIGMDDQFTFGSQGFRALARVLAEKNLESFSLWNFSISTESVDVLAQALEHSALTEFTLIGNEIQNHGEVRFVEAIRHHQTLKRLTIISPWHEGEYALSDDCAVVLADVLKENTVLEEIDIPDNALTNIGMRALAEALRENNTLTKLNISSDKCYDDEGIQEGLQALTQAVQDKPGFELVLEE